ncbi:MAG: response regulator [Elusimicrobia bacterium]|nr:response regulator [Elusimicrobiota bacterium]
MSLLNFFKPSQPLVMVVDDNPMLLEMYEVFLEFLNCKCIKVSDSREALATAETHKPHLILMDISMPELTGLQVLEMLKLKPATKNIPVLMITGEHSTGDIETAFRLGAADYLVKPADRVHFEQKVKPLLALSGYSFPETK